MSNEKTIDILEHNWTRLVNADYTDEELNDAHNTAIRILKSTETTRWKIISPTLHIYECERCGENLITDDISVYKYCHNCGRKVR